MPVGYRLRLNRWHPLAVLCVQWGPMGYGHDIKHHLWPVACPCTTVATPVPRVAVPHLNTGNSAVRNSARVAVLNVNTGTVGKRPVHAV
jgi:hypothetical protein